MDTEALWNHEEPVRTLGVDVPAWIDQDIDGSTVAAVLQGGCASGAYMPAVTYHEALATMNEHGNEILTHLQDYGVLESMDVDTLLSGSWAGLACYLVSAAVEDWAASVVDEITEALEEEAA